MVYEKYVEKHIQKTIILQCSDCNNCYLCIAIWEFIVYFSYKN